MTNLELFPMQALSNVMSEHGFEFPNARKLIAQELSARLGSEVKITPKFHECFNFLADLKKGRVREQHLYPGLETFHYQHNYMFVWMASSMEPMQVASYACLLSNERVLGDILAEHIHNHYAEHGARPSDEVNNLFKAYLVAVFKQLRTAWSIR